MRTTIYCKPTSKGIHSFYIAIEEQKYFLFEQNYRKGVNEFFRDGVDINRALDFSKAKFDNALIKTMQKLPIYIKYIEKNYDIEILKSTAKKNSLKRNKKYCA